jgi:methyl coenzyme M reductase subunit D
MRETGTHPRMSQPRDHGELVTEIVEDVEVGGERVVFAGLRRKEIVGMQPQRRTDADHATRRLIEI